MDFNGDGKENEPTEFFDMVEECDKYAPLCPMIDKTCPIKDSAAVPATDLCGTKYGQYRYQYEPYRSSSNIHICVSYNV